MTCSLGNESKHASKQRHFKAVRLWASKHSTLVGFKAVRLWAKQDVVTKYISAANTVPHARSAGQASSTTTSTDAAVVPTPQYAHVLRSFHRTACALGHGRWDQHPIPLQLCMQHSCSAHQSAAYSSHHRNGRQGTYTNLLIATRYLLLRLSNVAVSYSLARGSLDKHSRA